jgi:hypothetical protein
MRTVGVAAVVTVTAVLFCWCGAAQAYRPFHGMDAAVAETGEVEIELGPVEYLRDGADRTLLAPNDIAVDLGLRGAYVKGEFRAGVTFAFGVTRGPDILSRLVAATLHGVH